MRFSGILLASVVAAGASVALAQAGADLVKNGDFAGTTGAPTVFFTHYSAEFGPNGGYGDFVNHWSGGNGYEIWYPNAKAATTDDTLGQYFLNGQQWLDTVTKPPVGTTFIGLDGDTTKGVQASVAQTIDGLTKGSEYAVSFDWGAGQLASGTQSATTEYLQVSLGNDVQDTSTITNPKSSFTGWDTATLNFIASGTSEILNFLSVGAPNGTPPMAVLTGVKMQQVPVRVPVPEPSSLAILGGGLVGLGVVLRRRRAGRKSVKG